MAAYSSQNVGSSTTLHIQDEVNQELTPVVACSIPKDELEVLCELMVDFDKIEEHLFHLEEDIIFKDGLRCSQSSVDQPTQIISRNSGYMQLSPLNPSCL